MFFGGGTPSLVPPRLLERILRALDDRFGLHPSVEISMEMDPGTFDRAQLDQYVALGVNRVSLGVQSFDAGVGFFVLVFCWFSVFFLRPLWDMKRNAY